MNILLATIAIVNVLNTPMLPAQKATEAIVMNVVATAYSPRVQETDSTPFITASGTRTRDGVIAANFLPFGTKVRLPGYFGDKIFTIEDRMNRRYTHAYPHRIDILFEETKQAIHFGRQEITLEIIAMGSLAKTNGKVKKDADISLRSPEHSAS